MTEEEPIVPSFPFLMQHTLLGGFDGVAHAEKGTPLTSLSHDWLKREEKK